MKSILILDDETVLRNAFAAYFEDCLWQTYQAESAEEALKMLEEITPDAATVDIRLPHMDGDEFIREACVLKPKMVFVICTGSPEYFVPTDLQEYAQVSNQIFKKPMTKLNNLKNEIDRLIKEIEKTKVENDS